MRLIRFIFGTSLALALVILPVLGWIRFYDWVNPTSGLEKLGMIALFIFFGISAYLGCLCVAVLAFIMGIDPSMVRQSTRERQMRNYMNRHF